MWNKKPTVSEMIKALPWATCYGGSLELTPSMLFALGFVFMFTIGGLVKILSSTLKGYYMLRTSYNYTTLN